MTRTKPNGDWSLITPFFGVDGDNEFVANYCHRPPPKTKVVSGSWLRWWEPTIIEWEEVGSSMRMEFGHGCGIGTDGNWFCNYSSKAASQTAAGVELSIKHGRSGDEDSVVAETIPIPFPETVSGRKGKIGYSARWEEIPDAES